MTVAIEKLSKQAGTTNKAWLKVFRHSTCLMLPWVAVGWPSEPPRLRYGDGADKIDQNRGILVYLAAALEHILTGNSLKL